MGLLDKVLQKLSSAGLEGVSGNYQTRSQFTGGMDRNPTTNHSESEEGEKKDHDKDGDVDSEDWKMARDKAIKGATTKAGEDSDPCWDDHEMVGMKKGKGGKSVPNCVPKSDHSELLLPDGWSVR